MCGPRGSELVKEAIQSLEVYEKVSMEHGDYEYARGLNHCKYLVESLYVKILSMENDEHVSDRR